MKVRTSLKDLVQKIDWILIESNVHASRLKMDEVAVGFFPTKKGDSLINEVRMRFGISVAKELGWAVGDKIDVFNFPDDKLLFKLCKSSGDHGWKLQQESNSPNVKIMFKWKDDFRLTARPMEIVSHGVYEKQLVFRVGDEAIFEDE